MNSLQLRTECVARTPVPACLPLPRCYKRLGQAGPSLQNGQLRRVPRPIEVRNLSAIARATACPPSSTFPRHYKVPEQAPWWKQLAKTTLILPALVAAALLRPAPASSAQLAWRFWQSRPTQVARYESRPQSSWSAAEATAATGSGRWQRTLDATAFRTAAVVLSFFTMLYIFYTSFQDAPATPVTLGKIHTYKQMLAEREETAKQPASVQEAPASSETLSKISSYQQLLAEQQSPQKRSGALKPSRTSRIAEAIQFAAGPPGLSTARQSAIGLTPQQFTAGMEMPTPTRPVSVAARDPHRPAALREQPPTPTPARSYAAASIPTFPSPVSALSDIPSAATSQSVTETVDLPESLAPSSEHVSAMDTVDIAAEDMPPAVSMRERVMQRAQEIRDSGRLRNAASKGAKAASEAADVKSINVKPLILEGAAAQNGAGKAPENGARQSSQNGAVPSSNGKAASVSIPFRNNGAAPPSNGKVARSNEPAAYSNGKAASTSSHAQNGAAPSANGKSTFQAATPQGVDTEKRNAKLVRDMLDEIQQADDSVAKATAAIREPAPALLPAQASSSPAESTSAQTPSQPATPTPRKVSGDDIVRRLWTANPLGEIFDAIVGDKQPPVPRETKYDMLWSALQSSTARSSKYDAVYALLHSAALEADWGGPKSGPVHDLLHIGDAVSGNRAERRPAPGFLTSLLKIEETQSPTPRKGLIYKLLHLGDRIGAAVDSFKADFSDIVPQRADPLGDFLDSAADITDWEPMKWDPIAQLINGALSHKEKPAKYDFVVAINELEANSPINRPSKYDPLPGLLKAEAPRSRPAMDPFAGILGLVLAHGNTRADARAKRAAQSVVAPAPATSSSQAQRLTSIAHETPSPIANGKVPFLEQPPAKTKAAQPAAQPVKRPATRSRVDVKISADKVGARVSSRKWQVRYPFSSNGAGRNGKSSSSSNGLSKNGMSKNGAGSNGVANGWSSKEKLAVSSR